MSDFLVIHLLARPMGRCQLRAVRPRINRKRFDLDLISGFLVRRVKEKSRLLGPPFCSQVGGKPGCEKSQHKSPLIFFYATPPFAGLALPT